MSSFYSDGDFCEENAAMGTNVRKPLIGSGLCSRLLRASPKSDDALHLHHSEVRSARTVPAQGRLALVGSLVLLGLGAVPVPMARATNLPVNCIGTNPAQDLKNAIQSAVSGDTVVLGANCTFSLTATDNTTFGRNGLPVIDKTLTIEGNGATIERSTASGTEQFRIFEISSQGDLTLDDVTVKNGDATDPLGGLVKGRGGGIYNLGILNVVNNSTLSNNSASGGGGGIGNGDEQGAGPGQGTLTLVNSTVSKNKADHGGGIANGITSGMTLTGCIVSDNKAVSDAGVASQGPATTVTNCYIIDNETTKGNFGGIANAGSMTIINSYIVRNRAKGVSSDPNALGDGGGVVNLSTMTVIGSKIIDNEASHDAGGVGNIGSMIMIDNHIVDNHAKNNGGGVANNFGGSAVLTSNDIIHNEAAQGDGIFNGPNSVVTLTGSNKIRQNDCTNVPGC